MASIGQGYVLATPIQLAVMTARMAQGQNRITPVLREDEIESASDPIGVSAASMDIIRRGMYDVVNGKNGTAKNYKLDLDGIVMAGKTGTVQSNGLLRLNGNAALLIT